MSLYCSFSPITGPFCAVRLHLLPFDRCCHEYTPATMRPIRVRVTSRRASIHGGERIAPKSRTRRWQRTGLELLRGGRLQRSIGLSICRGRARGARIVLGGDPLDDNGREQNCQFSRQMSAFDNFTGPFGQEKNVLSQLQHSRQIQPASPPSAMRTAMFLYPHKIPFAQKKFATVL